MTPQPSPDQRIVSCTLSNYLADRRQQIVSEWMAAVVANPAVPTTDELTLTQLKDHIPQILDDLTLTLDDAFNQEIKERTAWRAAIHGNIRWEQHYDISQLIREIADLRTVLIYHLAEFNDSRLNTLNGQSGLFATVVLHSFFDRLIRISVEQFVTASNVNKSPGSV